MNAKLHQLSYFTFNRGNQALSTRLSIRFNLHRPTMVRSQFSARDTATAASRQGHTLVHFSAQLKRILWDRGAIRLGGV